MSNFNVVFSASFICVTVIGKIDMIYRGYLKYGLLQTTDEVTTLFHKNYFKDANISMLQYVCMLGMSYYLFYNNYELNTFMDYLNLLAFAYCTFSNCHDCLWQKYIKNNGFYSIDYQILKEICRGIIYVGEAIFVFLLSYYVNNELSLNILLIGNYLLIRGMRKLDLAHELNKCKTNVNNDETLTPEKFTTACEKSGGYCDCSYRNETTNCSLQIPMDYFPFFWACFGYFLLVLQNDVCKNISREQCAGVKMIIDSVLNFINIKCMIDLTILCFETYDGNFLKKLFDYLKPNLDENRNNYVQIPNSETV